MGVCVIEDSVYKKLMTLLATAADDSLEKYKVYSKREIAAILRNLSEKKQMIRMVFNHGDEGIITSVLYVDSDHNQVVLDRSANDAINKKILQSTNIEFEAVLDKIRILFSVHEIEDCFYLDKPGFLIALPNDLLRMQRREFYRVATYQGHIRIPVETASGVVHVETSLRDLSAGGVCVVDETLKLDTESGKVYHGCQVFLPDVQPITVGLQIRNSHMVTRENSRQLLRLGCQFIEISQAETALIQRCITKMEREKVEYSPDKD